MFKESFQIAAFLALIGALHADAEPLQYGRAIAPDVEAPPSIAEYEAEIAKLQAEHGVDGFALAEPWLGLGLAQQKAGDHAGAEESFANALQIRRTQLGLNDPGQIPIIDLLIDSHLAQRDWEQVDAHFRLLMSVHRENFGDTAAELIPIYMRYARWQLDASRLATKTRRYEHLVLGEEAAAQAHTLATVAYGQRDPRLVKIVHLRAAIAFDIAAYVSTTSPPTIQGTTNLDGLVSDIDIVRDPLGNVHLVLTSSPDLSAFIMRENDRALWTRGRWIDAFVSGRDALEEAVEIQDSAGDVPGQALALTLLGDWHFLYDRRLTAGKHYAEAQRLLAANRADPVATALSKPRALPAFDTAAAGPSTALASASDARYAVARFVVDVKGYARKIEIVETQPAGDKELVRTARRLVRASRFRPRIDNGKAVRTTGVEARYVIPHPEDERKTRKVRRSLNWATSAGP